MIDARMYRNLIMEPTLQLLSFVKQDLRLRGSGAERRALNIVSLLNHASQRYQADQNYQKAMLYISEGYERIIKWGVANRPEIVKMFNHKNETHLHVDYARIYSFETKRDNITVHLEDNVRNRSVKAVTIEFPISPAAKELLLFLDTSKASWASLPGTKHSLRDFLGTVSALNETWRHRMNAADRSAYHRSSADNRLTRLTRRGFLNADELFTLYPLLTHEFTTSPHHQNISKKYAKKRSSSGFINDLWEMTSVESVRSNALRVIVEGMRTVPVFNSVNVNMTALMETARLSGSDTPWSLLFPLVYEECGGGNEIDPHLPKREQTISSSYIPWLSHEDRMMNRYTSVQTGFAA